MSDDYLSRLGRVREISEQENRKVRDKQEFQQRESVRKRSFRSAKRIYNDRKVLDSKGEEIKSQISDSDYALGRYFAGEFFRGNLNSRDVERLFGEDYARKHLNYRDGRWGGQDTDKDKKVTNEEVGENRALIQSIAYNLIDKGHIHATLVGAKLYAKIGKGRKAIPKLVERAEEAAEKYPSSLDDKTVRYMKMFVKKHGKERQSSSSGLEGKTAVFILSTLAGITLSVFSFNATGNAVAGVTGTSQGLLGVLLFIVGITGIFFSIKK